MPGKKIGLALGGGTLRGIAHIGAIEILGEKNIKIEVLTGCSSGALVAAAYACGRFDELKDVALSVDKKARRKIIDFCFTGEGLIKGSRLRSFFDFITAGKNFEDLKHLQLAFVATDALTGREVIVNEGNIAEALEMTTALPGLAPLKRHKGRLVFDGGTAMLVPAKIAYRLGAQKVIAIDVGAQRSWITRVVGDARKMMRGTRLGKMAGPLFKVQEKIVNSDEEKFLGKAKLLMKKLKLLDDYEHSKLSFLESYLVGLRAISSDYERGLFHDEDADLSVRPDVFHIRRADVTKIKELIEEGRKAMGKALKEAKAFYD